VPGDDLEHLEVDLSIPAGWSAVAEALRDKIESSTDIERAVFVHAAATVSPVGFAGEVDDAAYESAVLLNTVAPQVLGRSFLDATEHLSCLRALVLLSTGRDSGIYPGWSAYKSGKAATDAWAIAEAAAHKDPRLALISVAPGTVDTDMQAAVRQADEHDFPRVGKFEELSQTGRLSSAEEAAGRIWSLVEAPPAEPLVDLREWPPTRRESQSAHGGRENTP
jgi:benzil reductase ((S)-benzoin forming)